MNTDPRLFEIDERFSDDEPEAKADAQFSVVMDNLIADHLRLYRDNPAKTDATMRRNGLTRSADILRDVFPH